MAFSDIECVNPVKPGAGAVPPAGVRIIGRSLGQRKSVGGGKTHYIQLQIGASLARGLCLTAERHQLRLLFGIGEDAGQIMLAVDNTAGKFLAKRDKKGNYVSTINAATADGLFALQFPAFTVAQVEVQRAPGCPAAAVFAASPEMLKVEG